jgi:hypothetical protein
MAHIAKKPIFAASPGNSRMTGREKLNQIANSQNETLLPVTTEELA